MAGQRGSVQPDRRKQRNRVIPGGAFFAAEQGAAPFISVLLSFCVNAVFYGMRRQKGSYSTSDLSRMSGDIIAEALRRPVTITQRKKPRLVLMNIEDYQRLTRQSDARAVGTIDTMPDALFAEVEAAVEAYAQDDETRNS